MLDFFKRIKKKASTFTALFSRDGFAATYNWEKGKSLSWYEKSLYLNKAINKRAQKLGQTKFVLKDSKGDVIDSYNKEAAKWLNLLDKPNDYQSGKQFWSLALKYYDIVGSAFILKKSGVVGVDRIFTTNVPESLELLRSDKVRVILNNTGDQITGFEYERYGGQIDTYEPEQIIYWYNPSPREPLLGESLISAGIRSIETEIQISEYQSNVIKNGGKPELVFGIEGINSQEELERIEENYQEKKAKKISKGLPMMVSGKWNLISSGLSPAEIGYLDTKVSTLNDIVILTSVPKTLLSLTEGETFANADASMLTFYRDTIKPLIEGLVNVLDWGLIPDDFTLDFIDETPEDVDKKIKVFEAANKSNAITTNEAREMLSKLTGKDLDPLKNGDNVLVPFNLVSLDDVMAGNTNNNQAANNASYKEFHPLKTKAIREKYGQKKDSLMIRYENKLLKGVDEFFGTQEERVLNGLGETKKRKDLVDSIFNDQLEISLAKSSLLPIIREIFMDNGQDTAQMYGIDFNFNSAIERALSERAGLFSESIINTTKEQLISAFQESAANNESRQQLIKRINELYKGISKGRAGVIARTETHAAMTKSNLEVYRQAGLRTKIWVTVGDSRVRPEHQELDGEEVPIDGYFSNGLLEPSEPNCRCQI